MESGVRSDGLQTTGARGRAAPASRRAAARVVPGTIAPTTPTGSFSTIASALTRSRGSLGRRSCVPSPSSVERGGGPATTRPSSRSAACRLRGHRASELVVRSRSRVATSCNSSARSTAGVAASPEPPRGRPRRPRRSAPGRRGERRQRLSVAGFSTSSGEPRPPPARPRITACSLCGER